MTSPATLRESAGPSPLDPAALAPPCRSACPADKDVPGFLRAIARGDPAEAWRIAYRDNLFPGVLGWICPHPCEDACRLGERATPMPVCDLKRWVTSMHAPPPDLGTRPAAGGPDVAVIGAGPAGLAGAHDLAVAGARVTLFDRGQRPGGLLTACIPAFRLPPQVAEADIERILSLGIRFEPGFVLREAEQLVQLREERGYAAVLLAAGGGDDREPVLPGWRATRVTRTAIAFLRDARHGVARLDGMRVLVVGGGNGAIDAARTALRVGAREVAILYRRERDAMTAFPDGVADAQSEGVAIHACTAVAEIVWRGGMLRGLRCAYTDPLDRGVRSHAPRSLPGTEHLRFCDAVIFAIGQVPTVAHAAVRLPGVFHCASTRRGGGTVVDAIAEGRRAAARLVDALAASGSWRPAAADGAARSSSPSAEPPAPGRDAATTGPGAVGGAAPDPALGDLLLPAAAALEAGRCLACDHTLALDPDLCILCGTCEERCTYDALAWRPGGAADAWRLTLNDAECRRCGDCVAGCPSGALWWRPWTHPNRICAIRAAGTMPPAGAFS